MEKNYITITGMEHYFGNKIFKVGDVISCEKSLITTMMKKLLKL